MNEYNYEIKAPSDSHFMDSEENYVISEPSIDDMEHDKFSLINIAKHITESKFEALEVRDYV